ncbi:ACP phosphodiesterase [Rheinheimera sp. UJ51]|uniref:acyl carrier protein phosphodiesterase n=1 Tax=Rheinheimera sp. UJ51 TaxID=2892446 RepID=UPI001E4E427C|nr:ACP phosphodiesterase [Rheinheimera sp. UJ51]MCC5450406.1 ACP phosphodiesterase [Rheinheimera sp. UJ51]
MMNYLAHLALAQPTASSLVGNLLGDFSKGVCLVSLALSIKAGLANHRAVDAFTDADNAICLAKRQFSPTRRRFAGVALDVLFDHFLTVHWSRFYAEPFSRAKLALYQQLAHAEPLMPAQMLWTMQKVRQQDWFESYQQLPRVGMALDRIAQRIRFANQFAGIITEITPRYTELEQVFLDFYPRLQQHVRQQALEPIIMPAQR